MKIPEIDKLFDKRHKKASLSLSINAIVVLVLAISMLGLGLAFTKSMFKKFGEKLTVPPPDLPATKDEPVVLPSEELEIRHGEEFIFQVNYYNDYAGGVVDSALECFGSLKNPILSKSLGGTTISSSQKVEAGQQKSFKFIIPKDATAGISTELDVCEVKFCGPDSSGDGNFGGTSGSITCTGNEDSKQITIRIT